MTINLGFFPAHHGIFFFNMNLRKLSFSQKVAGKPPPPQEKKRLYMDPKGIVFKFPSLFILSNHTKMVQKVQDIIISKTK